jgi:Tol biopolymer transport system component
MLISLDREAGRENLSPSERAYSSPEFSPDGRRIGVTVQTEATSFGAFVLDIRSGAWTRVNVGEASQNNAFQLFASWMPDGNAWSLTSMEKYLPWLSTAEYRRDDSATKSRREKRAFPQMDSLS